MKLKITGSKWSFVRKDKINKAYLFDAIVVENLNVKERAFW